MSKFRSTMRNSVRKRAQAKENEKQGRGCLRIPDGVEMFKPNQKIHNLDIIPYVVSDPRHPDRGNNEDEGAQVGALWYSRRYWVHRGIGANKDSYVCANKTWGQRCPICDYIEKRRAEGATREELSILRPKERQLFNVIDLDNDPDEVMLFDSSYHLFGKQLAKDVIEGEDGVEAFAELKGGYTLKCRFEKRTFQKIDFYECDRIDFKERKDDYEDEVVERATNLDEILIRIPYKELEQVFILGNTEEPEEEEEVEETPAPAKKSYNKPEQPVVRGSEEPEDDHPVPMQAKTKPAPKSKKEETEEFFDDPDDSEKAVNIEDEEEEAPRKKKGSVFGRKKKDKEEDIDDVPFKGKSNEPECPVEEGAFGKKCDAFDECDTCKMWSACDEKMNG